jgi:hypothetical protein
MALSKSLSSLLAREIYFVLLNISKQTVEIAEIKNTKARPMILCSNEYYYFKIFKLNYLHEPISTVVLLRWETYSFRIFVSISSSCNSKRHTCSSCC